MGWLTATTQLSVPNPNSQYWTGFRYQNQSGGSDSAAKTYFYTDTLRHWLISPPYNLGTGGNNSLEFDMALTANGSTAQGTLAADDKFMVVISTDEGLTWSNVNTLRTWAYPDFIPATGQHVIISLSAYSGIVRVGFYVQSTIPNSLSTISNLFIDNVKISQVTPVTLLEFTGKLLPPSSRGEGRGEAALLQWRTATEQNNKGFELQRSANGQEFSPIAFIPTQARDGNSNSISSYQFSDKQPLSGNNYYRLKQVDFDGHSSLSNIVLIKSDENNQLQIISVSPNPTNHKLKVAMFIPTAQKVDVSITDMAGKVVQQQAVQLQAGDNTSTVNVASLHNGTYFIKAVCSNGCRSLTVKFLKE